tara:strand:+ start:115 stop:528 length:414 start_codon:yes stop_codon:yes gene_type:complete
VDEKGVVVVVVVVVAASFDFRHASEIGTLAPAASDGALRVAAPSTFTGASVLGFRSAIVGAPFDPPAAHAAATHRTPSRVDERISQSAVTRHPSPPIALRATHRDAPLAMLHAHTTPSSPALTTTSPTAHNALTRSV